MALNPITTRGIDFLDSVTGEPWHYVGVSAFALFKRWLMDSGPTHLVAPILDEWMTVAREGGYDGPIVLRVFRYAHSDNSFGVPPWSYDFAEITRLTEFCGERGFYVDWTSGDSQHVLPDQHGPRGQQQHLNETCAALAGCSNAFVETSNESFKNGRLAENGVVPAQWGTYLRDSGAYGEVHNWPKGTNLDYVSYHGTRSVGGLEPWPKWLIDMFSQAAVLNTQHHLPAVLKEPIGADETEQPGRRSNRPECFGRMGLTVAFCAGVTFHSQAGLETNGLGPIQRACAVAFFRGVTAGLRVTP